MILTSDKAENIPLFKNTVKLSSGIGFAAALALCLASLPARAQTPHPSKEEIAQQSLKKRNGLAVKGINHTVAIPSNFPLPIYSSNVISTNFTNSTKGAVMAAATIITKDPINNVYQWYQTQCANSGWTVRTPKPSAMNAQQKSGKLCVLNAIKGQQDADIFCLQPSKKPNETIINICWKKTR